MRAKSVNAILKVGDVVYVAPPVAPSKDDEDERTWRLVQIPKVEGAIVVMNPHTGRILAITGGFSYAESQFNRAIQAKRQPGSTFKPIVYVSALDNGYSPSSIVVDAPFSLEQGPGKKIWTPENYGGGRFYGPSTLRLGIEKSRNLMTVRLAQDLGMPTVAEYARRLGAYDSMPKLLSMALGAGETSLLNMTTAYCGFVNGGKRIHATLVDRIQDRYGKTIWRHDAVSCPDCKNEEWRNQDEPELKDNREQVLGKYAAYQMVSILEGVVKRGTGQVVSKVGKPLAGKTGTTNDEKDAWFVGFSPDLAVGVYVGFDNPKPMGKGSTGGHLAAPIFRDFMKWALADKPAMPFRAPRGIKIVRIDAKTGLRTQPGTEKTILEAYKPNEEAGDPLSYVTSGVDINGEGGGEIQQGDPGSSIGRTYTPRPEAGGLY
jgi:penicillin-binding protein 1A